MKISINWLREYLKTDASDEIICSLLTEIGLEVSDVYDFESIKGGLKGILVGKVESCEKHPNADKLKITKVNLGDKKTVQIICGAPNIDANKTVLVAPVGSILYFGEKEIKIDKVKLRGIYSEGMICSEKELNISEDNKGIMILNENHKPGTNASDIIKIQKDKIIDIDLTPNRNDAMSHIGVAKDLYAKMKWENIKCKLVLPKTKHKPGLKEENIKIKIKDNLLCPRYSGITVKNIKVKESPVWIQNKLKSIGLKPINNIVDITNFILHETGHPLHAFDLDKIENHEIIVQKNIKNKEFKTLDSKTIEVTKEDLMICNKKEPMCLAGIMGGEKSMVDNKTKNIFIESAYFNPAQIRKSSKKHNINSDSSFRFERGCDPNQTTKNLLRAIELIKETSQNAIIETKIIDLYKNKIQPKEIEIKYDNINKILGTDIVNKDINKILKLLEIEIISKTDSEAKIIIPTSRSELTREIDIVEEVARIYGYNKIDSGENPNLYFPNIKNYDHKHYNIISDFLSNNGFFEVLNNSLINSKFNENIKTQIKMLNPLSLEMNALRESLLYGLLNNISYNINRKQENVKIFEFGNVYNKKENEINLKNYQENNLLALCVCGLKENLSWSNRKNNQIDFLWTKNIIDQILHKCGIRKTSIEELEEGFFEYGLKYLDEEKNNLVKIGKVKKEKLKFFNIKKEVFCAELNWNLILKNIIKSDDIKFEPNSRYPEVKRDLSLVIDKKIKFHEIENNIKKMNSELIKKIELFDVFEGNNMQDNKKSYSISIILEDKKQTLTEKTISKTMNEIIQTLKNKLNIEIRM